MEYDRILQLIERTSGLRSCAGSAGVLEAIPARSKVSLEERTQRFVVNRKTFRGRTFGTNHPSRLICVELFYARSST
jgi:hypothetical protein